MQRGAYGATLADWAGCFRLFVGPNRLKKRLSTSLSLIRTLLVASLPTPEGHIKNHGGTGKNRV